MGVEREKENIEFREKTKDWKVRNIVNQDWIEEQTKIVRFISDYDFNVEKTQKKDSFCERIITVLRDRQSEKEYKLHRNRFVLINIYRKPDSIHYNPRIVLTEIMLKQTLNEHHNSPTAGHYGTERAYLKIAEKGWINKLYERVRKYCKE